MSERSVTQKQLSRFVKRAGDNVTTIPTDASQWSALVTVDDKFYEVWTETCPDGRATIEPITQEQFDARLTADYRTVLTG